MSQNGLSMKSVGQGSRGTGTSGVIELGDPGMVGEWKLSSKRARPAAAVSSLSRKAAAKGVGSAGIAGVREVPNGVLLDGVPGDISELSSRFVIDMLRLFMLLKLDDEKFFLNLDTFGDEERPVVLSSSSTGPRCLNGEAGGWRSSDGLASQSGGDDGLRKPVADREPTLAEIVVSCTSVAADFAGVISSECWVRGGPSFAVSILSCFGFCPDSRRFRTDCADDDDRGGGSSGSDPVGGGAAGAVGIPEKGGGISVTVESEVAVVGGFEPDELCQVRIVRPLESDSRGIDGLCMGSMANCSMP